MTGRVRNKQGRSGVASGIDFDFDFSVDFGSMQLPDQILVRLSAQYVLRREKGASSFGRHVIPCAVLGNGAKQFCSAGSVAHLPFSFRMPLNGSPSAFWSMKRPVAARHGERSEGA